MAPIRTRTLLRHPITTPYYDRTHALTHHQGLSLPGITPNWTAPEIIEGGAGPRLVISHNFFQPLLVVLGPLAAYSSASAGLPLSIHHFLTTLYGMSKSNPQPPSPAPRQIATRSVWYYGRSSRSKSRSLHLTRARSPLQSVSTACDRPCHRTYHLR